MGIEQLVDTFKGNPQPLAQKVQKDQQGQPPGSIPPDLEEAMALQKISELRNGAQAQQAMQAGGAQPSVVEKLRQMLGSMQQQSQPQAGQPVMAASGGSLAQLMSNLGQNYAGGGIVAFSGPDGSKVEDDTDVPEWARGLRAERLAKQKALDEARARNMAMVNTRDEDMRPVMPNDPRLLRAPASDLAAIAPSTPPATTAPTASAPTERRPATNPGIAGGSATTKPAGPTMDPMEQVIRNSIMKTMGLDPEDERKKAIAANKDAMGLDALLKPAQERAATREAAIKQIQAGRQPLWVDALLSAGKPTRGGLGGVLGQMAVGANVAKQNSDAEDLKFLDELNTLNGNIDKAKIEGRYKDVAAGEAKVKDLISSQRQAEQSGTSLLNKEAQIAATAESKRQHDALMAANQKAGLEQRNVASAINAVKNDEVINRLQKDADALSKSLAAADKAKVAAIMTQIEARQNAIYKHFGVLQGSDTMPTAPGAASPGGTSKPGWGIKPL